MDFSYKTLLKIRVNNKGIKIIFLMEEILRYFAGYFLGKIGTRLYGLAIKRNLKTLKEGLFHDIQNSD